MICSLLIVFVVEFPAYSQIRPRHRCLVRRNTPANTGRDNKSKNAVTNTDHTNRGNLCMVIPGPRMLKIDRGQSMLPSEPYMTIFCHTALTRKTSIAEILVLGASRRMCCLIGA